MATTNLTRRHHAAMHAAEKLRRETRAKYKRMQVRLLKGLDEINKALDEIPKAKDLR